ncbi:MAG TPA: hypothetical protein VE377_18345 [Candidatus Dormibacteraeota bacterium]|nr:hypothetical protein [Candidatus Dormibacteraeota bacterium]
MAPNPLTWAGVPGNPDKMEQEQMDEFKQLQNEAMLRLRAGANRRGFVRGVQASVLPSFDNCRTYELMFPAKLAKAPQSQRPASAWNEPSLAVRTLWRRSTDAEKFSDPVVRLKHGVGMRLQPTIEDLDVNLDTESVSALLSRASELTVPPHILNYTFGLDGTGYELVFGQLFVQSRFQWWCQAPAPWEPLSVLLQEIEMMVEGAIQARQKPL